jgi:addiction module HigA family antidote
MPVKNQKPMHPGKVLASIFMQDHDLNQTKLAEKLGCTPNKINEIVNGKRGVTPEFALQLEDLFGLSASVWGRMQVEYDVWVARKKKKANRSTGGGANIPPTPVAAKECGS